MPNENSYVDRDIKDKSIYPITSIKNFSASSEDDATIAQTVNPAKRFLLDQGNSELHKFQFKLEAKKYKEQNSQNPLEICIKNREPSSQMTRTNS